MLTIEIGTTACKSIIFRTDGEKIAIATKEYPTYYPKTGWAEQNPIDWWNAVRTTTREVLNRIKNSDIKIGAVSVTGQMHSAIPVDAHGEPLYNCIILTDRRSLNQCREIERKISLSEIHEITGNRLDPYITAPKLLWIREEKPEIFEEMHKFLPPKDFIRHKLSNKFLTDHMEAPGTLLYDIRKREWSSELFELFGIPMDAAPEIGESTSLAGEITEEASEVIGLEKGTPVVVGAADDISILGTGSIKAGWASCHLASTGQVYACVDRPIHDPHSRVESYPHVLTDLWIVGGPTSAAGTALRWFRDNFAKEEIKKAKKSNRSPYQILDSEAAESEPGSNGIIFLPYLLGERCPIWNPQAKGVFFGLTPSHTKGDIYRAILEGVAYSLRNIAETIEELNVRIENLRIANGGARSNIWRQIIADVMGKPLYFTGVEESASFGSMILAAVYLGVYRGVEEACKKLIHVKSVHEPRSNFHKRYTELYGIYRRIYKALSNEFTALNSVKV